MKWITLLLAVCFTGSALADELNEPGKIVLTVFLRHDQSKPLDEINSQLAKNGFNKNFPPEGVEILSYHILMGVGHVITLRFPPDKLREVNLAFERGAWGAFRTEYYPTYDYLAVFDELKQKGASASPTPVETPGSPSVNATPKKTRSK